MKGKCCLFTIIITMLLAAILVGTSTESLAQDGIYVIPVTSMTFKGDWDIAVTYNRKDVVFYDGSSWFSLVGSNTGYAPSVSPTQWTLLAQKGDTGPAGFVMLPYSGTTDANGNAFSVANTHASSTAIYGEGYRGVYGKTTSIGEGTTGVSLGYANGYGIFGYSDIGWAGYFNGNVGINGTLTKSAGSFKIDHPLDPGNKYLSHSFVESSDMKNIYDGIAQLDEAGEAWVVLPEWFGALNSDFRYQLTCIGGFAPVYIAERITGNKFKIAGGRPGQAISWQVTGIRHDAWANAHRIQVEEEKPDSEKGFYLHPELFGQPKEAGLTWARHADTMKALTSGEEIVPTKGEEDSGQ